MDSKYERLYAAKAIMKEMDGEYKKLERECKEELLSEYREDGTDRKRSTLFGGKNAYMSVVEGKPSETAERFDVVDMQSLVDWMDETRPDTDPFAADNLAQFAEWYFRETGEVPDGCRLLTYQTEPKEPTVRLVVKEDAVIPILRESGMLQGGFQLLLGDGE